MSVAPSDTARGPLKTLAQTAAIPIESGTKAITRAATRILIARPPHRLAVSLSRRAFKCTWFLVLFFHLFDALYALALAYVYQYLRRPSMGYYVGLIQMLPQSKYGLITALYALTSALNFYELVIMVVYSILYRDFVFARRKSPVLTTKTKRRYCCCIPVEVVRYVTAFFRAISVTGILFDGTLLLREAVEIGSQTYQAYSSSVLISKLWINQLFGALVFLNCISNTAVHVMKREEPGMRRFLCTLVDLSLDFGWGFIFPGNIIFHYAPIFIANQYNLPVEYGSSDTLMVKAILDSRQFFIVSWADAFTTLLPYFNIYNGLMNVKILLSIKARTPAESGTSVVPSTNPAPSTSDVRVAAKARSLRRRVGLLIVMPMFGLFVAVSSIQSSGIFGRETCGAGCKLRMHPWFATHCACSVLEINCHERGIEGTASEMQEVFLNLDSRVLNSLIISHCPALSMPPEFQAFTNLRGLELYNISLVEWTRDAALTETHFPSITYLYISRSQVGTLPEGITYHTSSSLVDIEISACDIAEVPDDLDEKWPYVMMLYIEFCQLQELPMVMLRMGLTDVSFVGNNISVIPEDLPEAPNWMYVYFDRNPLQRLPERVGGFPLLEYLTIQHTNVSSFPQWIYETYLAQPYFDISANATPACEAYLREEYPEEYEDFVYCSIFNSYVYNGVYPLVDKDVSRRITPTAPLPTEPEFL